MEDTGMMAMLLRTIDVALVERSQDLLALKDQVMCVWSGHLTDAWKLDAICVTLEW